MRAHIAHTIEVSAIVKQAFQWSQIAGAGHKLNFYTKTNDTRQSERAYKRTTRMTISFKSAQIHYSEKCGSNLRCILTSRVPPSTNDSDHCCAGRGGVHILPEVYTWEQENEGTSKLDRRHCYIFKCPRENYHFWTTSSAFAPARLHAEIKVIYDSTCAGARLYWKCRIAVSNVTYIQDISR